MIRPCVIWDMCQTLADTRHRLPFILNDPPDWPEFDRRTMDDTVIQSAKLIFNALQAQGIDQIIMTGRGERVREMCDLWLYREGLSHSALYMRPAGVEVSSADLKKHLLGRARKDGWHPVLAFDDEPKTVRMYRDNGVDCFAADDFSWTNGTFREVRRLTEDAINEG